ncbi:YhjD/YihY/BrkB family envelope integrity protein [Actinoplanes sp. NPDC020271]|uniref:YhjD/YihY/BrkB family envelope integrity protein n=1 Tax=Actinoplanes sp. NPDC020271 TaxID=3363896 RepID=UPI0037AFD941
MTAGHSSKHWQRLRNRVGWVDHLARAGVRYDQADGGRLAAAVTYYAFFGTFAAWLLGFAIFGFVLDDPHVLDTVERYLAQDLPNLDVQALRATRTTAGVVALIGLPITGWFWADAVRSSIRRIWRLPEYPGRLLNRVLIDLLVLTGLGVLLVASLALAYTTTVVATRITEVADAGDGLSRVALTAVSFLVGTALNTVLAGGALTGLPRVRMPWRRLLGPAVAAGAAIELLKTLGRYYVRATEANPVYQLVAGSVGLLVFLSALNQVLLFAAALTATSTAGDPSDLAAARPASSSSMIDGMNDDDRIGPPLTGSERDTLRAWLDYHRATLARKCAGLTDPQLRERSVPPSTLTLLGLVRHMAEVERTWFRRVFDDRGIPLVWSDTMDFQAAYDAGSSTRSEAFTAWESEVAHARAIEESSESLDRIGYQPRWEKDVSLRFVMTHVLQEYARHNGHADLIREGVDGAVGA